MARTMQKKMKAKKKAEEKAPEVTSSKDHDPADVCETGKDDENEGVGGATCDPSSDDEAPDAIPLSEGKHIAMETMKNVSNEVKRTRRDRKRKRQQIHDLFRKQKEAKKLKKLARFPEKSLEAIARKITEERTAQEKPSKERKKKQKQRSKETKESSPTSAENQLGAIKLISLEKESDGEFVQPPGYEAAQRFREQQLFGDRHKRIPALSQQAKRYRNKPAKNFTSNEPQST